MEFRIAVPSKKEEREIDDALMAYNLRQAAPTQKDPFVKICRCAKAPDGSLAGGVLACSILWRTAGDSDWPPDFWMRWKKKRRRTAVM